ncbi:MAG TPA: M23 family metallopeptidase, partial [Telluria sp.]|nr:M23 family metallopeptidase [Telluria sp.]
DLPLRPVTDPAATPDANAAAAAAAPAGPKLMIPVEGIKYAQLSDGFDLPRGTERHHEALDIMAPKGTKVLAAADGKVAKLFTSKPGGLTVYQFDPEEKHAYYYAHLDRYADGVKEGTVLKRGDLVGYVGVTGNSDPNAPHLHFAVIELTPEKQWWKGTPVNPYPMLAN